MSPPPEKVRQAMALAEAGRSAEAIALLQRIHQQTPRDVSACAALSLILMSAGQLEQGAYYARRALALAPSDPGLLTNLGNALGAMNKDEEAAPLFHRALAANPRQIEAHLGLANIHRRRHEAAQALTHARAALDLFPADPHLAALCGSLLLQLARTEEAAALTEAALRQRPDVELACLYAHTLNYVPGATPLAVRAAHEAYARLLTAHRPAPAPHTNSRDPGRRLTVGLLSPDLRRHSVAFFLEPWLRHTSREEIELVCYFTGELPDKNTAHLRTLAPAWRECAKLRDDAIAAQIRADGIDILIETSGLTQGHRMGVMAMKPAPVQMTMIGYPATTGLAAIDYRLVDSITDPPGSEANCTERLLRLDTTFLCYQPFPDAPDPARATGGLSGETAPASARITFASFNAAMKLNPALLSLWARLLGAVPGSRLMLKSITFEEAQVRDDIRARLAHAGIAPERLEILPTLKLRQHMEHYHRVDVALDTIPYGGTTTTLEALWMGVPVVTLAGQTHASRVGASLLTAAGHPELIAQNPDEYIQIAANLAADRPRLDQFRTTLRPQLAASPLCDGPGYARRLESALREVWQEWCTKK